jgi:hypothetical protein
MSNERVVDLDDIVPSPKIVNFAGEKYIVPGDLPMVTYLKMMRVDQIATDPDASATEQRNAVGDLVDAIIELFTMEPGNEGVDRAELQKAIEKLGLRNVTKIVTRIYGALDPADDEADPQPPAPEAEPEPETPAGTTPTSTEPPTPSSE